MQSKTLIAMAVAGLLASPLALAQYDKDRSVSSDAPGAAATPTNPNATGKANEEKGSPPPAGASARNPDTAANTTDDGSPKHKGSKRGDKLSRNDSTYSTEPSPNQPSNPRSRGNPPTQGSSSESQ